MPNFDDDSCKINFCFSTTTTCPRTLMLGSNSTFLQNKVNALLTCSVTSSDPIHYTQTTCLPFTNLPISWMTHHALAVRSLPQSSNSISTTTTSTYSTTFSTTTSLSPNIHITNKSMASSIGHSAQTVAPTLSHTKVQFYEPADTPHCSNHCFFVFFIFPISGGPPVDDFFFVLLSSGFVVQRQKDCAPVVCCVRAKPCISKGLQLDNEKSAVQCIF